MAGYRGKTTPIFFGTDENAYGVARMYHELTGQKAIIYGAKKLSATQFSRYTDVTVIPHLSQKAIFDRVMHETLMPKLAQFEQVTLIALGDTYAQLIRGFQDFPSKVVRSYPEQPLFDAVTDKVQFYRLLSQYGLKMPDYIELSAVDCEHEIKSPYTFPVLLKATDSVTWGALKFPDHQKDYVLNSNEEINHYLRLAYKNGYRRNFVLQRFVHGDGQEYTYTAYVDQHHQVRGMALGRVALEDHTPWGIGNHDAIFPVQQPELTGKLADFLTDIQYCGIANIVFRYDEQTKQFLALELNARLERCSYWAALNGVNWVELMLKDADGSFDQSNNEAVTTFDDKNMKLWLQISPRVFKRYAPESEAKKTALVLLKQHRWAYGFKDRADWNLRRARMYHFIHASNRYHYETWGDVKVNPVVRTGQLMRWAVIRTINKIGPKYSLMN